MQNADGPAGTPLSAGQLVELADAVAAMSWVKESGRASQLISELVGSERIEGVMGGKGARFILDEYPRGICGTMPGCELTDLHVDEGYVFTRENGQPYHPDYLTQTVRRLMRLAAIIDARLHNLRHFFAAVLISAGYDIEAVSKALGHASVQITSKIYSALFNAAKAKLAAAAEALVWKVRAVPTGPVLKVDLQLKIPDSSLTLRPNLNHHRNW